MLFLVHSSEATAVQRCAQALGGFSSLSQEKAKGSHKVEERKERAHPGM